MSEDNQDEDPFALLLEFLRRAPPIGPEMEYVQNQMVDLLRDADFMLSKLGQDDSFAWLRRIDSLFKRLRERRRGW